jgi:hypothetical protein
MAALHGNDEEDDVKRVIAICINCVFDVIIASTKVFFFLGEQAEDL